MSGDCKINEYKDIIKKINELGEFCTDHFKGQLDVLKMLLKNDMEQSKCIIDFCKRNDESYDNMTNILKLHTSLTQKMVEKHESVENKIDELITILKKDSIK